MPRLENRTCPFYTRISHVTSLCRCFVLLFSNACGCLWTSQQKRQSTIVFFHSTSCLIISHKRPKCGAIVAKKRYHIPGAFQVLSWSMLKPLWYQGYSTEENSMISGTPSRDTRHWQRWHRKCSLKVFKSHSHWWINLKTTTPFCNFSHTLVLLWSSNNPKALSYQDHQRDAFWWVLYIIYLPKNLHKAYLWGSWFFFSASSAHQPRLYPWNASLAVDRNNPKPFRSSFFEIRLRSWHEKDEFVAVVPDTHQHPRMQNRLQRILEDWNLFYKVSFIHPSFSVNNPTVVLWNNDELYLSLQRGLRMSEVWTASLLGSDWEWESPEPGRSARLGRDSGAELGFPDHLAKDM